MGLDITAYEVITPFRGHNCRDVEWNEHLYSEGKDCWSLGHVEAFAYVGFEQSTRGLDVEEVEEILWSKPHKILRGGTYVATGRTCRFRAGSYNGYNQWRRQLCDDVHGVNYETFVEKRELFRDKPFFELIWFADNEGTIGPEAATDLACDFHEWHDAIEQMHEGDGGPWPDWFMRLYGDFEEAFKLASGSGLVKFS